MRWLTVWPVPDQSNKTDPVLARSQVALDAVPVIHRGDFNKIAAAVEALLTCLKPGVRCRCADEVTAAIDGIVTGLVDWTRRSRYRNRNNKRHVVSSALNQLSRMLNTKKTHRCNLQHVAWATQLIDSSIGSSIIEEISKQDPPSNIYNQPIISAHF
jgi:hypothetical protein